MTKYVVYKIIEADGTSKEGQAFIESHAKDGFGVAHGNYAVGVIKEELKRK